MFDITWIALAFALGYAAQGVGLPPLVGYLVGGFAMHALDIESGEVLTEMSELGITLLLFSIGLKLSLRTLAAPQVWGTAVLHMGLFILLATGVVTGLAVLGLGSIAGLSLSQSALLGFALSFSSTVFAVKAFDARGDTGTNYGRTAIGILIVQDLVAVLFMAASIGKLPSPWAVLLVPGLLPLRRLLRALANRVAHGELTVLFGFAAAVGGVVLFEFLQVKGDLGALVFGLLLAGHPRSDELSKALLSFKDLFLVAFFLTVGLGGVPEAADFAVVGVLLIALPIKTWLYFALLARFQMRARTSFLSALGLFNYSEFGLIVASVGAQQGWLGSETVVLLAVAVAASFVAASPVNQHVLALYQRWQHWLVRSETPTRLPAERAIAAGPATALVFGMGRIGTGAYDRLRESGFDAVVGVDSNPDAASQHCELGRVVIVGSGTDLDFWQRLSLEMDTLLLVVLTMPMVEENAFAARQLRDRGFRGRISAIAKFEDHERLLAEAGADHVFNFYRAAGLGMADDARVALDGAEASADRREGQQP